MKESLESARNIHQIVIVVSTIIGIFAFSIKQPENKFENALNELRALYATIESVNSYRHDLISSEMLEGLSEEDKSSIDGMLVYGVSRFNSMQGKLQKDTYLHFKTNWNLLDSVMIIKPSNITISASRGKDFSNDELAFFDGPPVELHPLPLGDKWIWETRYDSLASYKYQFKKVGVLKTGGQATDFMPNLRAVWEYVKNLDYEDTRVFLQSKSAEANETDRNEVDLSGLKVAAEYMYLIGPFVLLSLLVYLTTLINHLISITKLRTHGEKALDFPWLGLFSHSLSDYISIISLQIYPAAVCVILVNKSNLGEPDTIIWSLCYFVIFAVTSLYLRKQLVTLQRKTQSLVDSKANLTC